MSAALPGISECCTPTCPDPTTAIPGPKGDDGQDGTDGTNGANAFTSLTAPYVQPAADAEVTIQVEDSSWMAVGQPVFVEGGGSYGVTALPSATSATLVNLGNAENATPGAAVPFGGHVAPSGWRGIDGTNGSDASDPITTQGDLIIGDALGDPARLAIGADNTVLLNPAPATAPAWLKLSPDYLTTQLGRVACDVLLFQEEQVSGDGGGALTVGDWRTRAINTEVVDTGNYGSVAANQITLAAGTYRVEAQAVAYAVDGHQCRLQNITDGVTLALGITSFATSVEPMASLSSLAGRFTLSQPTVIELQHRCQNTNADGMGIAAAFGNNEVYSWIRFEREAQ